MSINSIRRIAGLQPLVENDASKEHIVHETKLFKKACDDLAEVTRMCDERLKNADLSDEHKKQYTALRACAKDCCEDMCKHLESYK